MERRSWRSYSAAEPNSARSAWLSPVISGSTGHGRRRHIITVKRVDNIGIVAADIDAAIESFTELGLQLERCAPL
jgi:hypothetical protein